MKENKSNDKVIRGCKTAFESSLRRARVGLWSTPYAGLPKFRFRKLDDGSVVSEQLVGNSWNILRVEEPSQSPAESKGSILRALMCAAFDMVKTVNSYLNGDDSAANLAFYAKQLSRALSYANTGDGDANPK